MPQPVDGLRAQKVTQNGSHHQATRSSDGRSPLSHPSPPDASTGNAPGFGGTLTISVNATPALLRALLALLGNVTETAGGSADTGHRPAAPRADSGDSEKAPPQSPPGNGIVGGNALSPDAKSLLIVLAAARREADRICVPEYAWITKSAWFQRARMDRHRKDATSLIGELMAARYIEDRMHGHRGKWRQFRATQTGAALVAHESG